MNTQIREGDIWLMERLAKEEAFDTFRFVAFFPAGIRVLRFLDAYFGLVQIEGEDRCLTIGQIDRQFPDLRCLAIGPEVEAAS